MSARVYLEHTKTKRRYEIVKVDAATKMVTLRGKHATFEEPFDKEKLKSMGYTMVKENPDAVE